MSTPTDTQAPDPAQPANGDQEQPATTGEAGVAAAGDTTVNEPPAPIDPEIVNEQIDHLANGLYALTKFASQDTTQDWLQNAKNEISAVDPEVFTF